MLAIFQIRRVMLMKALSAIFLAFILLGCNSGESQEQENAEKLARTALHNFKEGKEDSARHDIEKLLANGYQDAHNYYLCGLMNSMDQTGKVTQGDLFEKGIACYEKAINIRPDYELAWRGYLIALVEANRHSDAVSLFSRLWSAYYMPQRHSVTSTIYIVESSFLQLGDEESLMAYYESLVSSGYGGKNMEFHYKKLKSKLHLHQ